MLSVLRAKANINGIEYRWQIVGMLWFICFFNYADRQAIYSVFPLLERDLHLSPLQLGLLGSAFAWVYAVAGPLAGMLVDRISKKTAILAGLEVWSIICAATALSRRFSTLLLFRAAEGLGESIYFPASMSTLAAYHPGDTRSKAFGLHQTSVYAGTVAGGMFAGWIAEHYGWRHSFVLFGALGVLLGVLLLRYLKEPPQSTSQHKEAGSLLLFAKTVAKIPAAALLMFSFSAMNFVAVVQLTWIPSFLYQKFHLSLSMAALLATLLAQTGAVAGAATGGIIADRRSRVPGGRVTVQITGAILGIPFVILCGQGSTLALALIGLFGWGFCKGLYDANTFASLFDLLPSEVRGVSTGTMNSFGWLLGGTTAPIFIGYFATHIGLGNSISISAFGYLLAAALLISSFFLIRANLSSIAETSPAPL
jgi:MFS family permease